MLSGTRMRSAYLHLTILIGCGCLAIAGIGQYGVGRINRMVGGMYDNSLLPFSDLVGFKVSLFKARMLLVTMINEEDVQKRRRLHEQIKDVSRQVDAAVARGLSTEAYGARGEETFRSFSAVWSEFKTVRETQLIPALLQGRKKEAIVLALGPQALRFDLMTKYANDLILSVGRQAAVDRAKANRRAATVSLLLWLFAFSNIGALVLLFVRVDRLIAA